MSSCSLVMSTRRSLWLCRECARAILPTSDDQAGVEGGTVVEPQLGDPVPGLTALVRRGPRDQTHPVLPEVRQRLSVGRVLVQPPAVELLAGPVVRSPQRPRDLGSSLLRRFVLRRYCGLWAAGRKSLGKCAALSAIGGAENKRY